MGNLHEIAQIEPALMNGVAIAVASGSFDKLSGILAATPAEDFYMALHRKGEYVKIENMDGRNPDLQEVLSDTLTMASGGKMWCGYDLFVDRIHQIAPFLKDSLFLVADEVSMVDQFELRDGELIYSRVHEGSWCPLSEYIAIHFPNAQASQFGYRPVYRRR